MTPDPLGSIDASDDAARTRRLVERIVQDLWRLHGCGGLMDWRGVDHYLVGMAEQTHRDTRAPSLVRASMIAAAQPPERSFGLRRGALRRKLAITRMRRSNNGESPCSGPSF